MMMRWWKRLGKNHKGFSLVELICTIAIFSIIITGVGTAMVVSARSYQSGSVELDLQQQAQITSNLLTNLIIDADRVVEASGSRLVLEKVESGVLVTYKVILESDGNGGYQITYTSNGASGILAENVTASGFSVSQDDGGNVDFTLAFEEGAREYESVYHVTPRNGVTSGGVATTGAASLFVENDIVLEPGEVYDLNVRVLGTSTQGFTIEGLTDGGITDTTGTKVEWRDTDSSLDINTARITVGLGETSEEFHFQVKPKDSSIVPQDVRVRVRRVNAINVNGYKTSGTDNKAGASYKVTASLSGTNMDRVPGAWYDVNYVNPYTVAWSFEFTKDSTNLNAMDYIEITGQGTEGNVPYVMFELKQDLTQGCLLKVIGTAQHPEGINPADSSKTNKTGLKYDTVNGFWELEYQTWRRHGTLDIGPALDDSYFYIGDGQKYLMGSGEVSITGYSQNGQVTESTYQMNYFNTFSTDGYVTAEPGYGDINVWKLVLNTSTGRGKFAYSSPYFADNGYGGGWWSDCAYYKIGLEYYINDGIHAGETYSSESIYLIEDVKIKYKNAVNADWNRTNIVYVTASDNTDLYRVYFMFDKGWDDEYSLYDFADLSRFVGVIHEDVDDTKDIRNDIAIIGQDSDAAGNCYITFSLSDAEKAECKAIAASYGGIIKEIYEYNPFFGKLAYNAWDGTVYYPSGVTGADLAAVKGCEGTVEFHFVDPNIEGVAANDPNRPKVMYCPTITEYGPIYYIDDSTRFVIQQATAQYQQLAGGTWNTVYNLTWNGSGWTVN